MSIHFPDAEEAQAKRTAGPRNKCSAKGKKRTRNRHERGAAKGVDDPRRAVYSKSSSENAIRRRHLGTATGRVYFSVDPKLERRGFAGTGAEGSGGVPRGGE